MPQAPPRQPIAQELIDDGNYFVLRAPRLISWQKVRLGFQV
jgi:hypothetical protein